MNPKESLSHTQTQRTCVEIACSGLGPLRHDHSYRLSHGREWKDAEYILDLFRLCRAAGAKCEHLDKEQQQLKQYLQSLQAHAQQKGVPEHLFKRHPEVNRLDLRYATNAEQYKELIRRGKQRAAALRAAAD